MAWLVAIAVAGILGPVTLFGLVFALRHPGWLQSIPIQRDLARAVASADHGRALARYRDLRALAAPRVRDRYFARRLAFAIEKMAAMARRSEDSALALELVNDRQRLGDESAPGAHVMIVRALADLAVVLCRDEPAQAARVTRDLYRLSRNDLDQRLLVRITMDEIREPLRDRYDELCRELSGGDTWDALERSIDELEALSELNLGAVRGSHIDSFCAVARRAHERGDSRARDRAMDALGRYVERLPWHSEADGRVSILDDSDTPPSDLEVRNVFQTLLDIAVDTDDDGLRERALSHARGVVASFSAMQRRYDRAVAKIEAKEP